MKNLIKLRRIAGTDIQVSPFGLGCWAFGGGYWANQEHRNSVKTIQAALRSGINHFDTAPVYGNGRSEQVTGQQLKRVRKDVIIATKSIFLPEKELYKSIERSLKRLCTDYIDIFYIHWPKSGQDMRPMLETLEKARKSGMIRAVGVSNFSVHEIKELKQAGDINILQSGYSVLWREAEKQLIPYCLENNIAFIGYSPLAQGILTGKFEQYPTFDDTDRRKNLIFFEKNIWIWIYEAIKQLKEIALVAKLPLSGLILRWTAEQPGITGFVAGARTRTQLEANSSAVNKKIDPAIFSRISNISDDLKRKIPKADNIFRHEP